MTHRSFTGRSVSSGKTKVVRKHPPLSAAIAASFPTSERQRLGAKVLVAPRIAALDDELPSGSVSIVYASALLEIAD